MTKKRTGDAWMPAPKYAQTLKGLTINLLVRDIALALPFHRQVLGATLVYSDPDIAVFRFQDAEWMLHADHTYDGHPLHAALTNQIAKPRCRRRAASARTRSGRCGKRGTASRLRGARSEHGQGARTARGVPARRGRLRVGAG